MRKTKLFFPEVPDIYRHRGWIAPAVDQRLKLRKDSLPAVLWRAEAGTLFISGIRCALNRFRSNFSGALLFLFDPEHFFGELVTKPPLLPGHASGKSLRFWNFGQEVFQKIGEFTESVLVF